MGKSAELDTKGFIRLGQISVCVPASVRIGKMAQFFRRGSSLLGDFA